MLYGSLPCLNKFNTADLLHYDKLDCIVHIAHLSPCVCIHVCQTTNASAFLLHEVAKSPTIQNRLHTELVSVLGDSHRQVTAEDITKLRFAKNCIREILRCAVPSVSKQNDAVVSRLLVPITQCILQSIWFQYYNGGVSCQFRWQTARENPPFQCCNHVIACRVQIAIRTRNCETTVRRIAKYGVNHNIGWPLLLSQWYLSSKVFQRHWTWAMEGECMCQHCGLVQCLHWQTSLPMLERLWFPIQSALSFTFSMWVSFQLLFHTEHGILKAAKGANHVCPLFALGCTLPLTCFVDYKRIWCYLGIAFPRGWVFMHHCSAVACVVRCTAVYKCSQYAWCV